MSFSLQNAFTHARGALNTNKVLMIANAANVGAAIVNGYLGTYSPYSYYMPMAFVNGAFAITGGLASLQLWLNDRDDRCVARSNTALQLREDNAPLVL